MKTDAIEREVAEGLPSRSAPTGSAPTQLERARRRRRKVVVKRVAFYLAALVLLIPFVLPLWWMVATSLKTPAEVFQIPPSLFPSDPQWSNYAEAFEIRPLARQFFNSIYIAAIVTFGTLLFSSLAGYAFARIKFAGGGFLFLVLLCGLLLPEEVTIIPLYRLVQSLGWIDTQIPLIIIPIFGAQAMVGVFLMRQYFLNIPTELEDAARLDGLGRIGIFRHVALPLARPALAALTVLSFLGSWGAFLEPLVFLRNSDLFTLPVALGTYTDTSGQPLWPIQLAAATLTVLPIALVFFLAQRHFIAGLASGAVKS